MVGLNWHKVTDDKWALCIVERGYKIPFKEIFPFSKDPIFFQQTKRPELEEVNSLLQKRAVEDVLLESPGYYSRIFLVPKKNGKMRLIIDLSNLNKFFLIQGFRMENYKKKKQSEIQLIPTTEHFNWI